MKKIKYIITFLIGCILFCSSAYALDAEYGIVNQNDTVANRLKAEFDKGLPSIEVSQTSQLIIVYGKSNCSASSCKYEYQGIGSNDIEELLKRAVKCTNGQKNITYVLSASAANDYKSLNPTSLNGEVYWSELYNVTCVSSASGSQAVTLDSNSGSAGNTGSSGNAGSSGNIGSGNSGSGTGNSQPTTQYSSGTSTNQPQTGVETYYITLAVVAIVSYIFIISVKKYNLFKNI